MARRTAKGRTLKGRRDKLAENAALAAAKEEQENQVVEVPEWEVDMENRRFKFSSGTWVKLNRLSRNGLEAIQYAKETPKPPEMPMRRVALPNGSAQWVEESTDDYQVAEANYGIRYAHYVQDAAQLMSRFAFVEGVVEGEDEPWPDEVWLARREKYMRPPIREKEMSTEQWDAALELYMDEMKFQWVSDQMFQRGEPKALTEAIVGQTLPTTDGVAEAERTFPADDRQQTDQAGASG